MKEGKLQKQILDKASYTSPYIEIQREILLNILDEMKKEFYDILWFDEEYPLHDREVGDLIDDLNSLLKLCNKWF